MGALTLLGRPVRLWALGLNLAPAIGVIAFGWDVGFLVLVYWLENLIVGAFNVARMAAAGVKAGFGGVALLAFTGPFFVVHYGMFCMVHGVFVFALFQPLGVNAPAAADAVWSLIPVAFAADAAVAWSLGAFALVELGRFILFLRAPPEDWPSVPAQMFAPYARIVMLHVGLLVAGFALAALGSPAVGLLAVVVGKALFEAVFGAGAPKAKAGA